MLEVHRQAMRALISQRTSQLAQSTSMVSDCDYTSTFSGNSCTSKSLEVILEHTFLAVDQVLGLAAQNPPEPESEFLRHKTFLAVLEPGLGVETGR